ncbi:arginine/serine-rich protein 1-like [Tachysurus vachellii]|uniref:arginine/serine-rich protein 1-like n=1 Tax=Tachysurus vachellii TaxID=175792 RepID=UPI00296AFF72|nr:arginine/serine-rich protein 1-like [Tachysurus vachellii]
MRAEAKLQDQQCQVSEGMRLIFNQESSLTDRSSRSRSRSSDGSYSSSDKSRSRSVSRRPRHSSRCTSSSSCGPCSRSRSRPRCCRASGRSRCRLRSRSRSNRPYPGHSSRFGRRRYSRSISRSSSRERYYRRSRTSRFRSPSYRRRAPSPLRRSYSPRPNSPERSLHLTQKDKMELLNIARENAAKILGVEAVKLPASVRCFEEQMKQTIAPDTEKRVRADPVAVNKPSQDEGEANENVSRTSPSRKPITFSISNVVAKPPSSPTHHVTESKVTSRADRIGNRMPYGRWIPVKMVSTKKR